MENKDFGAGRKPAEAGKGAVAGALADLPKMEKAKRRAKNLLKMAREQKGSLGLENLAQAQDAVAKMDGYPDWRSMALRCEHEAQDKALAAVLRPGIAQALPEAAAQSVQVSAAGGAGSIFAMRETGGVPWFALGGSACTAFDLVGLPLESPAETQKFLSALMEKCSMRWNTEFHRLAVVFWQGAEEIGPAPSARLLPPRPAAAAGAAGWESFFGRAGNPDQESAGLRGALVIMTGMEFEEEHRALAKIVASAIPAMDKIESPALESFILSLEPAEDQRDGGSAGGQSGAMGRPAAGRGALLMRDASALFKLRHPGGDKKLLPEGGKGEKIELHPCAGNVNWLHGLRALASKGVAFRVSMAAAPLVSEVWLDIPQGSEAKLSRAYAAGLVNSLSRQAYAADDAFVEAPVRLVCAALPGKPKINGRLAAPSVLGRAPVPLAPEAGLQTTRVKLLWADSAARRREIMALWKIQSAFFESGEGKMPRMFGLQGGFGGMSCSEFLAEVLPGGRARAGWRQAGKGDEIPNPFMAQPGCRKPTGLHSELLANFFALLVSGPGAEKAEPGVMGLCHAVIERAYAAKADGGMPERWRKGVEPRVDGALAALGVEMGEFASWWTAVDALLVAGMGEEARLAQRWATPALSDFILALGDKKFRELYGKVVLKTGEDMAAAAARAMQDALSMYPELEKRVLPKPGSGLDQVGLEWRGGSGPVARCADAVAYLAWAMEGVRSAGLDLCAAAAEQESLGLPEGARKFYAREMMLLDGPAVRGLLHFGDLERIWGQACVPEALAHIAREARKHGFEAAFSGSSECSSWGSRGGMDLAEYATTVVCEAALCSRSKEGSYGLAFADGRVKAHLASAKDFEGQWFVRHSTRKGLVEDVVLFAPSAELSWLIRDGGAKNALAGALGKAGAGAQGSALALALAFPEGLPEDLGASGLAELEAKALEAWSGLRRQFGALNGPQASPAGAGTAMEGPGGSAGEA